MAPIVHGLEQTYGGSIGFVYLDVDDAANGESLRDFGTNSIPYYVLLGSNGEVLERWYADGSSEQFEGIFDKYVEP
jgi:hypothetical protein